MSKISLTSNFVKQALCPKDKAKWVIVDSVCKGLMLEVRASGGKTYYLKFRDQRGSARQLKLADTRDLSLHQVRNLADKTRSKIALGEDPLAQKRLYQSVTTFANFAQNRYLPYVQGYKRSWKSDECYLRKQILPVLGKCYLDEIKKKDIIDLFYGLKAKGYKPGTCNRALVLLRYAFNLAIKWEIPGVQVNPTKDIPLFDDFAGKRDRFLSHAETHRLLEAVRNSENSMLKYIVSMLILTGARKREVLDAKWADFNLTLRQWKIPVTKLGRPRYVPLSLEALNLLENIPRNTDAVWVFPNPKTRKPYKEIFKSWDSARKEAGLADVRMHDLRHSFASFLVNAGRSLYEVQRILGHTQIKTTQRYAHLSQDTLLDAADVVGNIVVLDKKF